MRPDASYIPTMFTLNLCTLDILCIAEERPRGCGKDLEVVTLYPGRVQIQQSQFPANKIKVKKKFLRNSATTWMLGTLEENFPS